MGKQVSALDKGRLEESDVFRRKPEDFFRSRTEESTCPPLSWWETSRRSHRPNHQTPWKDVLGLFQLPWRGISSSGRRNDEICPIHRRDRGKSDSRHAEGVSRWFRCVSTGSCSLPYTLVHINWLIVLTFKKMKMRVFIKIIFYSHNFVDFFTFQYVVWPLLLSITCRTRLGMESIKSSQFPFICSSWYQTWIMASISLVFVVQSFSRRRVLMIDHKFSIGF